MGNQICVSPDGHDENSDEKTAHVQLSMEQGLLGQVKWGDSECQHQLQLSLLRSKTYAELLWSAAEHLDKGCL